MFLSLAVSGSRMTFLAPAADTRANAPVANSVTIEPVAPNSFSSEIWRPAAAPTETAASPATTVPSLVLRATSACLDIPPTKFFSCLVFCTTPAPPARNKAASPIVSPVCPRKVSASRSEPMPSFLVPLLMNSVLPLAKNFWAVSSLAPRVVIALRPAQATISAEPPIAPISVLLNCSARSTGLPKAMPSSFWTCLRTVRATIMTSSGVSGATSGASKEGLWVFLRMTSSLGASGAFSSWSNSPM